MTLLAEELIGKHPFDNSRNRGGDYGSNHWGDSGTGNANHGLHPWLNSTGIHVNEGFYRAFSDKFKEVVLAMTLPNKDWKNGNSYSTLNKVFIPSSTELGNEEHNYPYRIGDVYAFFQGADNAKRVAKDGGKSLFYWTRSPGSYQGVTVRLVSRAGEFFYGASSDHPGDVYGAVRPALNLKSGILVSEIEN